jgi:hypothetical protein
MNEQVSDNFTAKALNSLPRSVLVVFGVLFALLIFLVGSGFNTTLSRIANAYAARIEKSIESLEVVVSRIAVNERRVDDLDKRVSKLEAEHIKK